MLFKLIKILKDLILTFNMNLDELIFPTKENGLRHGKITYKKGDILEIMSNTDNRIGISTSIKDIKKIIFVEESNNNREYYRIIYTWCGYTI